MKIAVVIVAIGLLTAIGYQIYVHVFSPYDTAVTYTSTLENIAQGDGIVFKDESVIENPSSLGVVNYLYTNGSRVAAHSQIARIYQNADDVLATSQIEQIDHQISQLQTAQSLSATQNMDISVLNKEFYNHYYNYLLNNIQKQNFNNLNDERDELTMLFNKKQIITGQVQNFNDSIGQLNSKKQQLQASITSQPQTVISDHAGYFVDSTDGLESQCTLEAANIITKDQLLSMISGISTPQFSSSNIGKVITDPKLMFEAIVPTEKFSDVKLDSNCTLRFKNYDVQVSAVLSDLKINPDQSTSLACFTIFNMTEQLAGIRADHVEIILNSSTGLRIPKTAIRTNEKGEMGVYVSNNVSMKFKKVDLIYEDANYILSKAHNDDASYLRLYDTIIIQGKDLYDNKPM